MHSCLTSAIGLDFTGQHRKGLSVQQEIIRAELEDVTWRRPGEPGGGGEGDPGGQAAEYQAPAGQSKQ